MTAISSAAVGIDRDFAATERAAICALKAASEAGVVGMFEGGAQMDDRIAVIESGAQQLEDLVNLMFS